MKTIMWPSLAVLFIYFEQKSDLKNTIVYPATDEEMDLFSIKYKLNKPGEDWDDSNHNGEAVGKAQVFLDGKVVKETPIYYNLSSDDIHVNIDWTLPGDLRR